MKTLAASFALALALSSGPASALTLAMVEDSIDINITYSGAKITIFASSALLGQSDSRLRLTLSAPRKPHRITRQHGYQTEHFDFASAPTVWILAKELPNLPAQTRQQYEFDMQTLAQPAPEHSQNPNLLQWRNAFTQLKRDSGLFSDSASITRLGKTLLRADFMLPPEAPAGLYQIRAMIFSDSNLLVQSDSTLLLQRQGVKNWLFRLAHEHAMLYGLLSVSTGLLVGAAAGFAGYRQN